MRRLRTRIGVCRNTFLCLLWTDVQRNSCSSFRRRKLRGSVSLNLRRVTCLQSLTAMSTVLSLIATRRLDDLAGLVKREAVDKFVQQASEELGYGNTHHLEDPDEVMALPHKVTLQSIVDQKYCDIEVNFIVLKKLDQVRSEGPRLLMCFIFAKFHRDYTVGRLPDWTITDLSLQKASSVD
ncbi:uncharacterized protein LOC144163236 isoform X2 [Haemaphysalis longicornis]